MKPLPWSHVPCVKPAVKPPYSMSYQLFVLSNIYNFLEDDIENYNRCPVTPF